MSAAEVLQLHQINDRAQHDGWWGCTCNGDVKCNGQHQVDALKAAGYAVVDLPKPTGVNGQDNLSWSAGAHYVEQEFNGTVIIGDRFAVEPNELLELAAKLLAAYASIEAQSGFSSGSAGGRKETHHGSASASDPSAT